MGHTDTLQIPTFPAEAPDYEADFHAWLMEQSRRLRMLRIPGIDSENIAEEIESLARQDKREVLSRFAVLLMHLLKWRHQPNRRGKSWRSTIDGQRQAIEVVLRDSPSLRPSLPAVVAEAYTMALRKIELETGLAKSTFPPACEWTSSQVLAEDFLPDA